MKEVEVIMYEANDGKLFDTKENCLLYESKKILKVISEMCNENCECKDCPFLVEGGSDCILYKHPVHWNNYL